MSQNTSQGPPVVPVSRPMTFSSGLWSSHENNSPVKLPPLHIALGSTEVATPGHSKSSSASPAGSSIPTLESRLEVGPSHSLYPARGGVEWRQQELQPLSPQCGRNQSPPYSREAGQNAQLESYHVDAHGSRPLQSVATAAPAGAPNTYYESEAHRGVAYRAPRDAAEGNYSDLRIYAGPPAANRAPPRLRIRQQPMAARACGFGERDRRLVDPPPILQLLTPAGEVNPTTLMAPYSQTSFAVVQASLWDESGHHDVTFAQPSNRKPGSRLMGTTFTTSVTGKDDSDTQGIFFAFSDLSCRTYGRFRLRFALMMIDPSSGRIGSRAPVLDYTMSDPFTVYSASDFPGMRPSTRLTKALRESGCAIPVKKGRRSVFGTTASEEEEEDEDEGSSKRTKRTRD